MRLMALRALRRPSRGCCCKPGHQVFGLAVGCQLRRVLRLAPRTLLATILAVSAALVQGLVARTSSCGHQPDQARRGLAHLLLPFARQRPEPVSRPSASQSSRVPAGPCRMIRSFTPARCAFAPGENGRAAGLSADRCLPRSLSVRRLEGHRWDRTLARSAEPSPPPPGRTLGPGSGIRLCDRIASWPLGGPDPDVAAVRLKLAGLDVVTSAPPAGAPRSGEP